MSKRFSIILGMTLLILSCVAFSWMTSHPPQAKKKPAQDERISVATSVLQTTDYRASIASYGRIQARTQSQLNAEVTGRISWVSPKLRTGAKFNKGDVLIRIDSQDYHAQSSMSQSQVSEARLAYEQELARSKQAAVNWERLGLDRQPTDLVLRKPQLAAAKAAWQAAQAELNMANNDISRTRILAPYDGWVLAKHVDVAQVVNAGTALAEIYSDGALEIRLPIALDDLRLIDLPENLSSAQDYPKATIVNDLGGDEQAWQATVIRSDAAIDDATQQLYVVAQIEKPAPHTEGVARKFKLKQYANAYIHARTFSNAIIVPNQAVSQGRSVFIVDQEQRLQRREISLEWQDETISVVRDGLRAGDEIVLTPLGDFAQGKKIKRINHSSNNFSQQQPSALSTADGEHSAMQTRLPLGTQTTAVLDPPPQQDPQPESNHAISDSAVVGSEKQQ